jgi:hypothetical protein
MLGRSALLSVATWLAFAGVLRFAVVPPESCGTAYTEAIEGAALGAKEWMVRNQQPDGRYVYIYEGDADRVSAEYNDVRHAGVTMALYQAAGRLQDEAALEAADGGLAWMEENLIRRDGWAALAPQTGRAKLGASALMLVGLTERRLATQDNAYDDLMRELGLFLMTLQREDGGFHAAWLTNEGGPDRESTSRFYPGEALWALALLHEALPNEGWDEPARRAADFVTMLRDEVEDIPFPPWADQWAAYGLSEMAEWGLDEHHIDYARRLAQRFGFLVRTEAQRQDGPLGTLVRGRQTRAAGLGTWVEGLSALWRLSSTDDRLAELEPKIKERLTCAAGILAARQVDEEMANSYGRPSLAEGAWLRGGSTRMDDQQHAFSGLLYTLDALAGRVGREPEMDPR